VGGIRDKATGPPWEEDTMVFVVSTTKGLAGQTMALAHSRGLFDYEGRVCKYWPEFAQQGKEKVTVRQLLSHQAGWLALDAPVDRNVVADLDRLAVALAQQKAALGTGNATGLSRHQSWFLRRRAAAPGRSAGPQPGAVLRGGNRLPTGA
jgi:CubicO group peptidase (beta-lactamase class C family)